MSRRRGKALPSRMPVVVGDESLPEGTVSVVVPVLNAARTLPACLAAVAQLDPRPMEILFVDNGSVDGSPSIIHAFQRDHPSFPVRVLTEPRRGAASARNTGIQTAKGDVIVLMDADCAPERRWLHYLILPFENPETGAVAGRVTSAPATSTVELFSALYTLQLPPYPQRSTRWTPWEGGYVTANFSVRTSILKDIGGIDEASVGGTAAGSDYDLCARLYKRGHVVVYAPEAVVVHYHRTTVRGMMRQAFDYGESHAYLLGRRWARGLWIESPFAYRSWPECPVHAWVNLVGADKKVMAILMLGVCIRSALWLLPLYGIWLAILTGRRARASGAAGSVGTGLALAGLLLVKSGAMTMGRWYGSVKYGVCCF